MAEQTAEVDDCLQATGARPIEWLAREGLLDPSMAVSAPGTGAPIAAAMCVMPGRNIRIDPTDHRARRLLAVLLRRPRSRLEAGNLAGAINLPDLVYRLRGLGFELPCERIKFEDRDGCTCWPGVCSASAADRDLIRRTLRLPAPRACRLPAPAASIISKRRCSTCKGSRANSQAARPRPRPGCAARYIARPAA